VSSVSEFQTAGAEQRKGLPAKLILVVEDFAKAKFYYRHALADGKQSICTREKMRKFFSLVLLTLSAYDLVIHGTSVRHTFDDTVICKVKVDKEQQVKHNNDATHDQLL